MSAAELVEAARFLTEVDDPGTAGLWPRAAAFLARQALEQAMDDVWEQKAPGVEASSVRAQLLCLPVYAGEEVAEAASATWWALTQACHHHVYELAPTEAELDRHFLTIEGLLPTADQEE